MVQKIDARGEQCPVPVIKAREAIKKLSGEGRVEILVDNEIAVQNLKKMAEQKGYGIATEKVSGSEYRAIFSIGNGKSVETVRRLFAEVSPGGECVVVISGDQMGDGDAVLGKALLKGFIYALSKAEELPDTILFYNRGAFVSTRDSESLEDLQALAAQGVEILTCGTCLNHYELADLLAVGSITNMYTIVEKMMCAGKIIKP